MLAKKKLFVLFLVVLLLIGFYVNMPTDLVFALDQKNAEIYIYCRQTTLESTNIGNMVVVKTTFSRYNAAKKASAGIDGVSLRFEGTKADIDEILKKLQVSVVFSEILEDIVCIYGYSPKLKDAIVSDGNKINIQISFNQQTISIGTPLILGSY